jgi:hypothetical protein
MATLAVEINDVELVALDDGEAGGRLTVSPGVAVIEHGRILTGEQAVEQARLKPRRVNSRFWRELDDAPLGRPFDGEVSHADVAYEHLSAVWRDFDVRAWQVLVAVAGCYSRRQLGLMLGVARAAGLPVAGLVDAAVSAVSREALDRTCLHVDLRSHDVVATEVRGGEWAERGRVRQSEVAGLAAMRDAWSRRLAEVFVKRTRFDPLHDASSEQALYLKLPALVEELASRERSTVALEAGATRYEIEVEREEMIEPIRRACDETLAFIGQAFVDGRAAAILLSHRAASIPGLRQRLAERLTPDVTVLPLEAPVAGALEQASSIRSEQEQIPFVTRLPRSARRSAAGAARPERRVARVPTHLVHDGLAYLVSGQPLAIESRAPHRIRRHDRSGAGDGASSGNCIVMRREGRVRAEVGDGPPCRLNGARVRGVVELTAGDRLRIGSPGIEVRLVAVVDDGAATGD